VFLPNVAQLQRRALRAKLSVLSVRPTLRSLSLQLPRDSAIPAAHAPVAKVHPSPADVPDPSGRLPVSSVPS